MRHIESFHPIKLALVFFTCLGMAGCQYNGPLIGDIVGPRNLIIEGTVSDVESHKESCPDIINFVVTTEEGDQRQRIAVMARAPKIEGQVVENSHVRVKGGFDKKRTFMATRIEDAETGAIIDLMEAVPNWLRPILFGPGEL